MGHLVLADLRRHVARTALTALGIAFGVAAMVALLAVSAGIERSAAGLIRLGGAELGVFQGGVGELTASSLPRQLVAGIRAQPGVEDATPIAVATGELPGHPSFLVFGVEPGSFVFRSLVVVEGRAPRADDEAMVGDAAARALDLHTGDRLLLKAGGVQVSGVYHAGVPFEDQGAALTLRAVGRLRGREGEATTIAVKVARGVGAAELGDRLGRTFPGTVAISQPGQIARVDTSSLLIRKGATVFAVLALLIGGIAVMNTMLMAVFERRTEFALLLAVGWPRRLVGELVLRQGLVLGLAGAAIGLALGTAASGVLVRALGASGLVTPHLTFGGAAVAVLVAAVTGTVGSLYPAWWVTRLRVSEALG
jgi:putative ABC transport system permease protein